MSTPLIAPEKEDAREEPFPTGAENTGLVVSCSEQSTPAGFDPEEYTQTARNYLRQRGVSLAYAWKHKVRPWDGAVYDEPGAAKARERLLEMGLPPHPVKGLYISYLNPFREGDHYGRIRPDVTTIRHSTPEGHRSFETTTELPKFTCPIGRPVEPYVIQPVWDVREDVSVPLSIVEGPIKALSLCEAGILAIGLGGVNAGATTSRVGDDGTKEVVAHATLADHFEWAGRKVNVIFDAGIHNNPMVALGAAQVWRVLSAMGADVRLVKLPLVEGRDQGPDDFIASRGADALTKLIESAVSADPVRMLEGAIPDQADGESKGVHRARVVGALDAVLRDLYVGACLQAGGEGLTKQVASIVAPYLALKDVRSALSSYRGRLAERRAKDAGHEPFERGDHVEIADRLLTTIESRRPVYAEGEFWGVEEGLYTTIDRVELSRTVQGFAGAPLGDGVLRITQGAVTGSIQLLADRIHDPEFFVDRPGGVRFSNGYLQVGRDGSVTLSPHSPDQRCRYGYDFEFEEGTKSSRFLQAAADWFHGDPDATEKTQAMLEHLGLTILGYATSFERAAVYYGPSADNGKSTAAAVFRGCIPREYVSSLSPQQLGEKFSVAELAGKRANIMDDLPSRTVMDSEILKVVITGKNPIKAERKNQDPFSFVPSAGWLVCGNTLPHSDDPTEGYFRRWLVITFARRFSASEKRRDYHLEVLQERPQIVAMAIQAAIAALKRGEYTIPSSHEAVVEAWRGGEPVRAFVLAHCERVDAVASASKVGDLYGTYKVWAVENGHKVMSSQTFGQRLDNIGLRKHTKTGNVYMVRLRPTVPANDQAPGGNVVFLPWTGADLRSNYLGEV